MSITQAALRVLEDAGEPLHYKKIAKLMKERGLWSTSGKTPATTVNSDISEDINTTTLQRLKKTYAASRCHLSGTPFLEGDKAWTPTRF